MRWGGVCEFAMVVSPRVRNVTMDVKLILYAYVSEYNSESQSSSDVRTARREMHGRERRERGTEGTSSVEEDSTRLASTRTVLPSRPVL